MSDKQPDWFSAGIGPGWKEIEDGVYRRVTDNPNGSTTTETRTIYDDDTALYVKSNRDPAFRTVDEPDKIIVASDATYQWLNSDGTVSKTSTEVTQETIHNRGRTWITNITDGQGKITSQRGTTATYKSDSGSEVVTTTNPDGTSRVDTVTWESPREGTRTTNEKDEDGNITNTTTDDVIRDDDGKWEAKDPEPDDDPGSGNPGPEPPGGDAQGGGDDPGSFGPGGPDGGDSSGGDSGEGDGDEGDDGPGDTPPGPIIPGPPLPHQE